VIEQQKTAVREKHSNLSQNIKRLDLMRREFSHSFAVGGPTQV
jgi:hypothetical protein